MPRRWVFQFSLGGTMPSVTATPWLEKVTKRGCLHRKEDRECISKSSVESTPLKLFCQTPSIQGYFFQEHCRIYKNLASRLNFIKEKESWRKKPDRDWSSFTKSQKRKNSYSVILGSFPYVEVNFCCTVCFLNEHCFEPVGSISHCLKTQLFLLISCKLLLRTFEK